MDTVNLINTGSAVNVAGNLSDDLSGDGGCSQDRFGCFNLGITHLETLQQHPFHIDKHAIKHRKEGRVIQIVIMDFSSVMGLTDMAWQNMVARIVACYHPRQQVALGWNDFAIFVGILIQNLFIILIDDAEDFPIETITRLPFDITSTTKFNITASRIFVATTHQIILNLGL